jgi:hypothetical protein
MSASSMKNRNCQDAPTGDPTKVAFGWAAGWFTHGGETATLRSAEFSSGAIRAVTVTAQAASRAGRSHTSSGGR